MLTKCLDTITLFGDKNVNFSLKINMEKFTFHFNCEEWKSNNHKKKSPSQIKRDRKRMTVYNNKTTETENATMPTEVVAEVTKNSNVTLVEENHLEITNDKLEETVCETFPCGVCDYVASNRMLLEDHELRMHSYFCAICDYATKDKKDLETHKMNTDGYLLQCEFYDEETMSCKELQKHIDIEHRGPKGGIGFKCKECPYWASTEAYHEGHMNIHIVREQNRKKERGDIQSVPTYYRYINCNTTVAYSTTGGFLQPHVAIIVKCLCIMLKSP